MPFKKKVLQSEMPEDFSRETVATLTRIDENLNVIGIMYLKDREMKLCTVPENMSHGLIGKLPVYTDHVRQALGEINVLDELVAYRIESRTAELLIAPAGDSIACVVLKMQRKPKKKHKTRDFTTA